MRFSSVEIPLAGDDAVVVDFNTVYHDTFAANVVYGMVIVDYTQPPEGFETYDAEDRRRIEAQMKRVKW